MFTLCMSRGANKHLQDNSAVANHCGKQVKGGYLLRYKRGWLFCGWCEEWVVLYEDSTMAWFADKGCAAPRGRVRLRDAPELLAAGEWTRRIPRRPRLPPHCRAQQLLAFATAAPPGQRRHRVHWLMAQSPAEVNDWMTAISNTLPPPPRLTIDRDKRCSVTLIRDHSEYSNGYNNSSAASGQCSSPVDSRRPPYSGDHTVPAGVVVDWGHGWGWGWGEAAWAAQLACAPDTAVSGAAALYCAADDYSIGEYGDVMDYSACGDFSF